MPHHLPIAAWVAVGLISYLVVTTLVVVATCRVTGKKAPKPPSRAPELVKRNTVPPPGYVLGFFRERRPAEGAQEQVRFGWYGVDGGKGIEVVFKWEDGATQPYMFISPESLADISLFHAVMNAMAKFPAASLSPANICLILSSQSFADLTGEKACTSRKSFLSSLLASDVPLRFCASLGLLRNASCC